jgi:hypothetical protein
VCLLRALMTGWPAAHQPTSPLTTQGPKGRSGRRKRNAIQPRLCHPPCCAEEATSPRRTPIRAPVRCAKRLRAADSPSASRRYQAALPNAPVSHQSATRFSRRVHGLPRERIVHLGLVRSGQARLFAIRIGLKRTHHSLPCASSQAAPVHLYSKMQR